MIVPIAKGQFIVSGQLAGENAGSGLPSLIPTGMRAVGVPVNDVTSVAGFVTPGTRVDVLMTPNGEHRTITVLQNVAVARDRVDAGAQRGCRIGSQLQRCDTVGLSR